MRDEFPAAVKAILGARAGYKCSNPKCDCSTSGPSSDPLRSVNIGVAAHITAASIGGPRYDAKLTKDLRSSAHNGIWLCQNCAKLIDSDSSGFKIEILTDWKKQREHAA